MIQIDIIEIKTEAIPDPREGINNQKPGNSLVKLKIRIDDDIKAGDDKSNIFRPFTANNKGYEAIKIGDYWWVPANEREIKEIENKWNKK